jgi:hypothetical protein
MATFVKGQPAKIARTVSWYRELSRYQWFVFIVASLGRMFDTMDQQLFNLARRPAIVDLMKVFPGDPVGAARVAQYSGYVNHDLYDRLGVWRCSLWRSWRPYRPRQNDDIHNPLVRRVYGPQCFSTSVWDFSFYRFLTGLGVGGHFSVAVAIVAETVPDRARPNALGWLQALSTVGNMLAALVGILLGQLQESGTIPDIRRQAGAHALCRCQRCLSFFSSASLLSLSPPRPKASRCPNSYLQNRNTAPECFRTAMTSVSSLRTGMHIRASSTQCHREGMSMWHLTPTSRTS